MNESNQVIQLPDGWVWTGLEDVCQKIQDGTHFSPKIQYEESGENRYLYITAKNVKNEGLDLSNITYIDREVHEEIYKRCNPEQGDVLIVKDGVNTGDVTINYLSKEFSLLSSVALLKPIQEALQSEYLQFYFRSPIGFKMVTGQMTGSAIKRIVLKRLRKSTICLPPLNEQRRIVAKIEELRAHTLRSQQALDEIPALIDQFRQSVLAAAFRGDLTADWRKKNPNVEPAEQLLEQFSRLNKTKNKQTTVKKNIDKLGSIPDSWTWRCLNDICNKITDGEHLTPPTVTKGIPLLSAKDVRDNYLDFSDTKYVSDEIAQKSRSRCNPEKNDVLVVSRGATVGRTCHVKDDKIFCLMGSVLLFKVNRKILNPKILQYFFKSPFGTKILPSMSGASAQQAIYIRDMKGFLVPIPSIKEQLEIIRKIEDLFYYIDVLQQAFQENQNDLEILDQSILAKAFRGELVPQDPNDEPASVLLDRIRAEREKLGTTKTQKRSSRKRTQQQ